MGWALHATLVLARVAVALAINAIVIVGFFRDGWSAGTVLALYWCQTVIGIPLTALLVILHRRATRKLGHYRGLDPSNPGSAGPTRSSFLLEFTLTATVFALAHGIFLALMVGVALRGSPGAFDRSDFETGLSYLAMMLLVGFLADLPGLRSNPFAWIRHRTETLMRRVILTHMVIIIGMFAAAISSHEAYAFFGVFIAFKLFADIAGELPAWDPPEPPGWIVWLIKRFGNAKTDFSGEWHQMRDERRKGLAEAERTLDDVAVERASRKISAPGAARRTR